MTSHLYSKLNRCTDSPRSPEQDSHPVRSKHALSLSIMRWQTQSHEKGESRYCRTFRHGSFTMRGAYFTSTLFRDKKNARSCSDLPAWRSFDAPNPVHQLQAKGKHLSMLEKIHFGSLRKRRLVISHPSNGRAPPKGKPTHLEKPGTTSDFSALLDLDFHHQIIGGRKQIDRLRGANLLTSLVRARVAPIHNPSG